MGKLKGGILGPVKGKVGAVVGSVIGGQNVVKSMPASYSDKKSESQVAQRNSFRSAIAWFQALAAVVSEGFQERMSKHSAYNAFMSENVGISIIDDIPVWNELKVSKGSLTNPNFEMNTTPNPLTLQLNWVNDADGSAKLSTDRVVFVAINPANKEVAISNGVATRQTESVVLNLPAPMQGVELQTYAFVKRSDGKKSSTSKRTGAGVAGSDLAGSVQ